MSGPLLFSRFAYPPNVLGHCGPDRAAELLERVDARCDDADLRALAAGFDGAWPYLTLIAHANGIADPLDERVVEAYWLGSPLLDRVGPAWLGPHLEERVGTLGRTPWRGLAEVVEGAPRPHHGFHVFCVYPWVGLLRTGATDHALDVLDRCRIRWGAVAAVDGDGATAVVRSSPLAWDGRQLGLGPPRAEVVTIASGGRSLAGHLRPGDHVACHWHWACHRLSPVQVRRLRAETRTQIDLVNRLAVPPPAVVLS